MAEASSNELHLHLCSAINLRDLRSLKSYLKTPEYRNILNSQMNIIFENKFGDVYGDGETVLHVAADMSDTEIVTSLLEAGANPNMTDNLKRIPLHLVLDGGCRCEECSKKNEECASFLIDMGSNVNAEDFEGRTPLYYAAHHMMSSCASILLKRGADLHHRTKNNTEVGFLLVQKVPEVIVAELDQAVKLHDTDGTKLELDFSILLQRHGKDESTEQIPGRIKVPPKEMDLLVFIQKADRPCRNLVLNHPLTEAFLYLKWGRVNKWFWLTTIFYYLLAILYTFYIFNVFLTNCGYQYQENEEQGEKRTLSNLTTENMKPKGMYSDTECKPTVIMILQSSALTIGIAGMMINEIYEMYFYSDYFRIGVHYAWWIFYLTVSLTIPPGFGKDISYWLYPVAGFGVFYAWGMTLVHIGSSPYVGVYVEMLGKVLIDFAWFLLAYIALLIGFAMGFCVLFPQNEMFQATSSLAFVKILLIMTGESDYEALFNKDSNDKFNVVEYSVIAHILFVGCIIIITIVLMNLLLGLAVSDIQKLQNTSSLITLKRQIQQISKFENPFYEKLLFHSFKVWMFQQVSIRKIILLLNNKNPGKTLRHQSDQAIILCPADPYDKTLPDNIKAKLLPYLEQRMCLHKGRHHTIYKESQNTSESPVEAINEVLAT